MFSSSLLRGRGTYLVPQEGFRKLGALIFELGALDLLVWVQKANEGGKFFYLSIARLPVFVLLSKI